MPRPPWEWSESAQRYRDPATGRFIGQTQMVGLRDVFTDYQVEAARSTVDGLAAGRTTMSDWVREQRESIKTSYIDQYVLGHGGRGSMTQADWGRLGAAIKEQYHYLDKFAAEIADGKLTVDQVKARIALYHEGSVSQYERAKALAMGLPDLPAYPGDGGTACITNCRCTWDIQVTETGWDCYWVVDEAAEHCEDCLARAGQWNPLRVERNG